MIILSNLEKDALWIKYYGKDAKPFSDWTLSELEVLEMLVAKGHVSRHVSRLALEEIEDRKSEKPVDGVIS